MNKETVHKTWHCGTLAYTKAGLITLFAFLLWGDFCCMMMQTVIPSILPLKLKALGASNVLIGILLTSICPVFGLLLSPYLSFKSDYLRSRWGRRIPFFALSLPFVVGSILLLAFSDDISRFLHISGVLSSLSPAQSAILVIGICIVAFQFADILIMSVFNYIFNDTVPVMFIGRFMGLMRIVGGAVGFLYNYFIFKYAESHMKEIFIWTALLYLVGMGMMCIFVKEGEYPPVTEKEKINSRGVAGFKTFFRESFSCKFYWTKFLYSTTGALTWTAIAPFYIFFYKDMGLSLEYVGKAFAITSVAGIAAAYFSAIFLDRWHPLRIMTYSSIFSVIFTLSSWVWLFVTPSPDAFFWLYMLGTGLIGAFHGTLGGLAGMPCDIRLQPKSRFGQFCSAQSILRNSCTIVAGLAVGLFFDGLKWVFHGSDYIYRFNFAWTGFWLIVAAAIICSLYRQWKNLGGDLHFHPPASWSESGYEEMEQSPFVGTQRRWLNYALAAVRLTMQLSIIYLIPLTFWLWHIGWSFDAGIYLFVIAPLAVLLYLIWGKIERGIKADVKRCAAGEPMLDGIPHHGVFFMKACAILLMLLVLFSMTIVAIHDGLQGGVIVFGISNLVTNAMVIIAVFVLRRLERGFDPMLDYDGRKEENRLVTTDKPQTPANDNGAGDVKEQLPVIA